MALQPFKAMKFVKNDVITKSDMDQMNNNLQNIHDNTPRGRFYKPTGVVMDARTVVVGGRARIKKNRKSDDATVKVRFPGGAFDPDCHPHITTGIVCEETPKVFCVVNGPDTINYPNYTGFDITVNMAWASQKRKDFITKEFWVAWHAFGYREEELEVL